MNCIECNKEYYEKIADSKLELVAIGDSNWDYYINENKVVYYVAKEKEKNSVLSGNFGDYDYFVKRVMFGESIYQMEQKYYDKLIERIKNFNHAEKNKILARVKPI